MFVKWIIDHLVLENSWTRENEIKIYSSHLQRSASREIYKIIIMITSMNTWWHVVAVQSLRCVQLFVTPWRAACQAPLSSTISQCWLKFMSIQLVMLSNHLILCCPLLLFAFNISQHQGLFQLVSSSHEVVKILELQLQHGSFQWIFRADFL